MTIVCPCFVPLMVHFPEPGLIAIIQAYAGEPTPNMDIVIHLNGFSRESVRDFGFAFRYNHYESRLEMNCILRAIPLNLAEPYELADMLVNERTYARVHEFIETRHPGDSARREKYNEFITRMSKDLREFSTPRCRH